MDPLSLEIVNPATSPERLAELAQLAPQYAAQIAAHPNAYPGLVDWLRQVNPAAFVQQGQATYVYEGVPRRRRRAPLVVAIIAIVALVLGGATWGAITLFAPKGAATAQAAADQFTKSLQAKDVAALLTGMAPSEIAILTPSSNADIPTADRAKATAKILGAVSISLEGLSYGTPDDIDVGSITALPLTAGTMTVSVTDVDAFADGVVQYSLSGDGVGQSGDAIESLRKETRDFATNSLPYTVDFAEAATTAPVALVSVKEGGWWYVSPLLSLGQSLFDRVTPTLSSAGTPVKRGTIPSSFASYNSPQTSLVGFEKAIWSGVSEGDWATIGASLPMAERRFYSLYVEPLLESSAPGGTFGGSTYTSYSDTNFDPGSATVVSSSGDTAHVLPKEMSFGFTQKYAGYSSPSTAETKVTIDGLCGSLAVSSSKSYLNHTMGPYCLDYPKPESEQLGVTGIALTSMKEGGAWFMSPLRSLTDIGQQASAKLSALNKAGTLEDVLRSYQAKLVEQVNGG